MTLRLRAVFLGMLAFAMGVLLLVSSVAAQNPFDKFREGLEDIRPKGELLRKIFGNRDDDQKTEKDANSGLFGSPTERQSPFFNDPRAAAEKQRRAAMAQSQRKQRQQGEEQDTPSWKQQPTLAPIPSSLSQRYPAEHNPGRSPATGNATYSHLTPPPLPPQPHIRGDGNAPAIGLAQPLVEPLALQPTNKRIDLGIAIRSAGSGGKSKGLLIESVDSRGFGAKSGLRKGDLITGIGGIDIGDEEEFNSIASVMREGDLIEFELIRNGKPEKILVQFGESSGSENGLDIIPSPNEGYGPGDNSDLDLNLSESAPVDHVASSWTGSDGQAQSPGGGKLRSVLVNEPWPTAPTNRNRR